MWNGFNGCVSFHLFSLFFLTFVCKVSVTKGISEREKFPIPFTSFEMDTSCMVHSRKFLLLLVSVFLSLVWYYCCVCTFFYDSFSSYLFLILYLFKLILDNINNEWESLEIADRIIYKTTFMSHWNIHTKKIWWLQITSQKTWENIIIFIVTSWLSHKIKKRLGICVSLF